jgi:electron transfer flavoprotein beta subunit
MGGKMMNIAVPVKVVPDLVEELLIDEHGTGLDTTWLRMVVNEFDDHAIEQAILLKENHDGEVTVIAADTEGVDDIFFTAAAKGADRLVRLSGAFENGFNNHALACALQELLEGIQPDLVLTGVQAHNDLDGALGPLLAGLLGMPYIGYVAGVKADNGSLLVNKEYPGGLVAELEVTLPAVLGIQAAETPPRYVAFSRIRQAMQTAEIEEYPVDRLEKGGGPVVTRMYQPESGVHAEMIEGDTGQVSAKLVELFRKKGLV